MICQWPANKAHGLVSYFIIGEVEPGDKESSACTRMTEDLAIILSVDGKFADVKSTKVPVVQTKVPFENAAESEDI